EQTDAFLKAAQTGDAATLRAMLEAGQLTSRDKNAALYLAVAHGQVECFQLLLAAGAELPPSDENGNTPLMAAAGSGKEEILRTLLAQGIDVNAANRYGYTPLMNAATEGKVKAVRLLLQAGANVNAQSTDAFRQTP